MSVYNNVCGSATLYGEENWMMHGLIKLLVIRNKYDLSTGYLFLVVFVVMEMTRHSLVIEQSKRRLT